MFSAKTFLLRLKQAPPAEIAHRYRWFKQIRRIKQGQAPYLKQWSHVHVSLRDLQTLEWPSFIGTVSPATAEAVLQGLRYTQTTDAFHIRAFESKCRRTFFQRY